VKLEWIDNGRPGCGYNNVTAMTLFGEILITWKSWKDYPTFCVDEPDWLTGKAGAYSAPSLEAAKEWCQDEYERMLREALGEKIV
jgi:hypothetical protein